MAVVENTAEQGPKIYPIGLKRGEESLSPVDDLRKRLATPSVGPEIMAIPAPTIELLRMTLDLDQPVVVCETEYSGWKLVRTGGDVIHYPIPFPRTTTIFSYPDNLYEPREKTDSLRPRIKTSVNGGDYSLISKDYLTRIWVPAALLGFALTLDRPSDPEQASDNKVTIRFTSYPWEELTDGSLAFLLAIH